MEGMFNQKYRIFTPILICIFLCLNSPITMAEAGENITPDLENSPLENLTFTTPSEDLSEWEISVSVSESSGNVTKLKLETQICVFDPILCHAPEIIDMTNTDNSWNGIITTLEKHSYVNWRIHIVYENGSEMLVPERSEGYAKVWSTCWEIMQNQEIITGGDKCDDVIDEDGRNISGFPIFSAIISLTFATIVINRNQ